jgi:hypothetical protein
MEASSAWQRASGRFDLRRVRAPPLDDFDEVR